MTRTAAALAILVAGAASARANDPALAVTKKRAALVAKQAAPVSDRAAIDRDLARRVGRPAEAVLSLRNLWTREVLVVPASGPHAIDAPTFARFLRCHFTNQVTAMDLRLLEAIVKAARSFNVGRVDVVSGYRAPKYNLILRKKGHAVARDSQHSDGHAVDFRLPGVSAARLRSFAVRLRLGGVGFYPESNFVHVDVGPIRQWTGE